MFGKVCDTAGCRGAPVARVVRRFAHPHRRGATITTDRELCAAPGCLEHAVDLMYQPETLGGRVEPMSKEQP